MKNGTLVSIRYTNVDSNKPLQDVGKSYGLVKLKGDDVHWSDNGK